MSIGRNNRKKLKKKLRKKFGPDFKREYDRVIQWEWSDKHPFIGTLEQIIGKKLEPYQKEILKYI